MHTIDISASTKRRLNEEQPLTKAMLSDFMPVDPVNPHAPGTSAVMVEGTIITDCGIERLRFICRGYVMPNEMVHNRECYVDTGHEGI